MIQNTNSFFVTQLNTPILNNIRPRQEEVDDFSGCAIHD